MHSKTQQSLIERRTGHHRRHSSDKRRVGKQIWEAEDQDLWSRPMLQAALDAIPNIAKGDWKDILKDDSAFFFMEHQDGLKSTVAMVNRLGRHYAVAVKLRGQKNRSPSGSNSI